MSSVSSASTATRAATGGPPATGTSLTPSKSLLGIGFAVLGGIGVIGAVAAQAFAIDHGSNQKPIDANNITTVWSIIIGVILLIIGAVLWFTFAEGGEYKYNMLYGLAFSSYAVATIALYMSTTQVIVRESTN
jgi:hypothetical protein